MIIGRRLKGNFTFTLTEMSPINFDYSAELAADKFTHFFFVRFCSATDQPAEGQLSG